MLSGGEDVPLDYLRAKEVLAKLMSEGAEKGFLGSYKGAAGAWDKIVRAYEYNCECSMAWEAFFLPFSFFFLAPTPAASFPLLSPAPVLRNCPGCTCSRAEWQAAAVFSMPCQLLA
jgi:hypothetical protein